MTTQTGTLADFLSERIAEDEAVVGEDVSRARQIFGSWADLPQMWWERGTLTIAAVRVHAECDAKRRIVEQWETWRDQPPGTGVYDAGWKDATLAVLRLLALPYADHPDYLPEWRP